MMFFGENKKHDDPLLLLLPTHSLLILSPASSLIISYFLSRSFSHEASFSIDCFSSFFFCFCNRLLYRCLSYRCLTFNPSLLILWLYCHDLSSIKTWGEKGLKSRLLQQNTQPEAGNKESSENKWTSLLSSLTWNFLLDSCDTNCEVVMDDLISLFFKERVDFEALFLSSSESPNSQHSLDLDSSVSSCLSSLHLSITKKVWWRRILRITYEWRNPVSILFSYL